MKMVHCKKKILQKNYKNRVEIAGKQPDLDKVFDTTLRETTWSIGHWKIGGGIRKKI